MPHYRFYTVCLNGHIKAAPQLLECATDAEAMAAAAELRNANGSIEVWEGVRLVGAHAALPDVEQPHVAGDGGRP